MVLKQCLPIRQTLFEAAIALCQSVDGGAMFRHRGQRRLRGSTLTNTCADWKNNVPLAIVTTLNIPPHLKQQRIVREFGPRPIPRERKGMFIQILLGHTVRRSFIIDCATFSLAEIVQPHFLTSLHDDWSPVAQVRTAYSLPRAHELLKPFLRTC